MDVEVSKYKALVIDDEMTVRTVIQENLFSMGFTNVLTAVDGEEGLKVIREEPVDIVFLDLAMPGVPGEEVAHLALGMKPDLVIIVVTGFATLEKAITLMRRGIYDLVRKPFNREELQQKIQGALKKYEERCQESLHEEEYVGPYRILEEIAAGGGGIVYRAEHRETRDVVALKILISSPRASEEKVLRFHREARTILRLRHGGIVSVRNVGSHNGRHYIAMDFIEGESLEDFIQEKKLTLKMAVRFSIQVAEAVQYAHEQGVIHRDIKPSNIIVDHGGGTHIIDFGLAKILGEKTRLTKSYRLYGTLGYIAPERFSNADVSDTVLMDIFSIGVLLYEMLVDTIPYRIDSAGTFLPNFCAPPLPLTELNPQIPSVLSEVVLKALSCDPMDRFPSASEYASALRTAFASCTEDFPLFYD